MGAKKTILAARLSAPVRTAVMARVLTDGYGEDLETWTVDALATAVRSPQGLLLRFPKARIGDAADKEEAEESRLL
jgi:hypothetical protein